MHIFGQKHLHLKITSSTNDEARMLISQNFPEGTIVTATHQTHGRGRFDRTWIDESGLNCLGSYILYPTVEPSLWIGLSVLTGISVYETIQEIAQIKSNLKWPNDVLIDNKKVAGILIETTIQSQKSNAIIGIGINVNQIRFDTSMRLSPTSLKLKTKKDYELAEVIKNLSIQLDIWYERWLMKGTEFIVGEWKKRSDMIGQMTALSDGNESFQGEVLDINSDGSIRFKNNDGTIRDFYSGEISN